MFCSTLLSEYFVLIGGKTLNLCIWGLLYLFAIEGLMKVLIFASGVKYLFVIEGLMNLVSREWFFFVMSHWS